MLLRANVIRSHQNTLLTNSCPDVTMLYLVGMTDCKDTWRPWMGGNDHETVQHWSMTCLRWTRGPNPCYVNVPQSYHNTTQSLVDNYGTSLNGIFATFKPYHQPESIVIVIMSHVASPAGSYQRHYERSRVSWCSYGHSGGWKLNKSELTHWIRVCYLLPWMSVYHLFVSTAISS